jgi:apolipoprotein N-acyltransferase
VSGERRTARGDDHSIADKGASVATPSEHRSPLTAHRLLIAGFALTFIHLFWYGSVWTAWLALVCYAPFLAWLRLYSKRPFLAGWVFGLWYAILNNYWLGQFISKWTQSVFIGGLAVFTVGAVWGSFYGVGTWASKVAFEKYDSKPALRLLVLLLPLMDFLRQTIPEFQYPFTTFGEPLVVYPWVGQYAHTITSGEFSDLYVGSFFLYLLNVWISLPRKKPDIGVVLMGFVIFGLPALTATFRLMTPPSTKTPTKVALGQLGFDLAYTEDGLKPFKIREAANDLIRQARAQKADVLILPEAVAAFATTPNTAFDLPPDLPVLFGAQRGPSPRYQSAYLWDTKGFQFTDKTRLVVFGEYVPLRGIIPYPAGFQLPAGDLAEGEAKLLRLPNGLKIGTMICFESLFPGAGRNLKNLEPDILSIISLDDWYMGTSAIPRLEIAARWRAVETGKWIFRVGSLGKTMVIDPQGRVRAELPTGERKLLVFQL